MESNGIPGTAPAEGFYSQLARAASCAAQQAWHMNVL